MTQFQNGWKKATDALDSHPTGNSRKEKERAPLPISVPHTVGGVTEELVRKAIRKRI
jgi:hypothetical protein